MGYLNPVITKRFPELGDDVWVTIRNPKTMTATELRSKKDIETDEQGKVVDSDETMGAGNEVIAKIIIGWRAYDGSWVPEIDPETGEMKPGQEQPRLPLPATAELVAKLPLPVFIWLGEEIAKINPQVPTSAPEAGTGKTS